MAFKEKKKCLCKQDTNCELFELFFFLSEDIAKHVFLMYLRFNPFIASRRVREQVDVPLFMCNKIMV